MTPIASAHASHKLAPLAPSHLRFTDPSEVNPPSPVEHTGLLPTGTYPPSLPRNPYELPYAAYRPASAIDAEADFCRPTYAKVPPAKDNAALLNRKTMRTVSVLFNSDRRLSGAKIDLSTGEVVEHQYKDYFSRPKAQPKLNAPDSDPFWMHMAPGTRSSVQIPQKDTSRCKRFNAVKMYVDGYLCLSDAADDLPLLLDIIESANRLDLGGSTRPLNSSLLFGMLQHLDMITPQAVAEFMGCHLRHAQKVALCLRVIVNAFEKSAEGKLSTATYETPPKKKAVRKRGKQ
jgi:hypothetical protein